jgi:asparagine synthetase B (glutamine-hydrolysing)
MLIPLTQEAITSLLTLRYYRYRTDEETVPYKEWTSLSPENTSLENAVQKLNKLLDKKLNDLPNEVALLFSGGLDSSYLMSRLKGKTHVTTITLAYRNKPPDTFRQARDHFRPDASYVVDVDTILRDLPKQIEIQGYPLWHLYSYYVMKKASELQMPLFTGDGGDEALAGYEFRYKAFMESRVESPKQRIAAYLMGHNRDWVPDQHLLFHPRMRFSWQHIRDLLIEYFVNPLPPLRQVFLADYHGKLRWDWVPMYRKWACHFGITLISPFLEPEVMQFGHSLPNSLLFEHNKGKVLLREGLKRLRVPRKLVSQPKGGFSVGSLDTLWKNEGKRIFSRLFFNKKATVVEGKIIRQGWIDNLHDEQTALERDPRYLSKSLQLIATETWHQMLNGEMTPDDRL